jgi:hypothetical protein
MKADTLRAQETLLTGQFTCVLCKDNQILTDDRRGVKPLLELLEQDLSGFCAADKVVGKAAAMLYRLMGVSEVYAQVISEPAIAVLETGGISVYYDRKVSAIRNRSNTGFCPMETAVWNLDNPKDAPAILRSALSQLSSNPGSN